MKLGAEPCSERHCPHGMSDKHGSHWAARPEPTANVAWCCRCHNVLCVPTGIEFEENTHGLLYGVPRLLPWRPWGQTQCCLTCGADVVLRCGCSAPLDRKQTPPVCSRGPDHVQTQAATTPRCWCPFRPEVRTGRFANG